MTSRRSSQGDHRPPPDPDKVEPTIRDALIGLAIGIALVWVGMRLPYRYVSWPLIGLGVLFVLVMSGFLIATSWTTASPMIARVLARTRGHTRLDPVLGTLTRNVSAGCWEGAFAAGGRQIDLVVDGRSEPDPTLVARAREVVADFESIQRQLDAFLREAAQRESDPELSAQIAGLRVSAIRALAGDGEQRVEIDFRGPDEDVFWSCTYANGEPVDLWFD